MLVLAALAHGLERLADLAMDQGLTGLGQPLGKKAVDESSRGEKSRQELTVTNEPAEDRSTVSCSTIAVIKKPIAVPHYRGAWI